MSENKIKCIHVGLGKFSLKRLQINLDSNLFEPVAYVDINLEKGKQELSKIKNIQDDFEKRIFKTISEAKKKFDAEACFIFVSSEFHANLIIESLENNLHTICVKSIACNLDEFKKIIDEKNKNKNLLLVQGLNNQWSDASLKMAETLNDKDKFGEFLVGYCVCWGRQDLKSEVPLVDSTTDGIFYHSMGCHQLGQLVKALGLPLSVTSRTPIQNDEEIGYLNINRTAGGSCLLEYPDNKVFSYIGTRAAHSNPFGFAARWSGSWMFHGTKGDIKREGGRISVFQKDKMISDTYVKDLDLGLIEDDRKQFEEFYDNIKNKSKSLERLSLQTWLLMEALNISSRKDKKIELVSFIKDLGFEELL